MSDFQQIRFRSIQRGLQAAPAIVLGLYAGRIAAELARSGLVVALLLTIAALVICIYALRGKAIWRTWPLLVLLSYVLYPEPDQRVALLAGAATSVTLILSFPQIRRIAPLTNRHLNILTLILLASSALVLYVNTLAPDILPADAGEFQLVAARWGVAHPTGFPLYSILANLFERFPLGPNAAYRTNLLSAITSTATLLVLYLAVHRLSGRRVGGLLAAAVLATSTTFWSQSTTANVRSLTGFLTVTAFYFVLLLRERSDRPDSGPSPQQPDLPGSSLRHDGRWLPAVFVFLLVLAVTHHSSLVFIGGLFGLCAAVAQPSFLREPARWPALLLAATAGLLPLLYLPLRGAAGAIGAPEDLDTLRGFLNHVLGLGFRGDLFFFDELSVLWARLSVMVNVLTFQFSPVMLLAMLLGLIMLFRRDRLLAVVLATSMTAHTLVAAAYRAPQTVEYMLPVYVLLAATFGYSGAYLRDLQLRVLEGPGKNMLVGSVAALLLTGLTITVTLQLWQNYDSFRTLSRLASTRDYVQPLLQDAPPDAILLADWHWATPLWYLQEVEAMRQDVEVRFVSPGVGLYAETWARQIAGELADGRPVIATHYDLPAFSQLPTPEPFHRAFLFRQEPLMTVPEEYQPLSAEIGPKLSAVGLYLPSDTATLGREFVVQLAWRNQGGIDPGRTLYAHLIGPDGRLYGADDQPAQPRSDGLAINRFGLTPFLQTPPGRYELVIGSYASGASAPAGAMTVAQIDVQAADSPPFTRNAAFRPLTGAQDGRTLIGYDWDSTLPGRQRLYLHWSTEVGYETQSVDIDGGQYTMPEWSGPWGIPLSGSSFAFEGPGSYIPLGQGLVWLGQSGDESQTFIPGERVKLTQDFTTSRPVLSDLVVSLRLVGYREDGATWDWWDLDDGVPAMGAIPTLKWIAGSRIQHPVYSTVSPDAQPGQQSEPLLLLYDAFTSRRLPILDERIAGQAPWIPLGREPIASEP